MKFNEIYLLILVVVLASGSITVRSSLEKRLFAGDEVVPRFKN